MIILIEFLTVAATGLLAGALLTEACVLVPYWQKMPPAEFLSLHHTMSTSLFRYFAPLTIMGTSIPIVTGVVALLAGMKNSALYCISALCAITLLVFYFGFFKNANQSFVTEQVPEKAERTLATWSRLHNIRTAFSIVGFFAAVAAIA